MALIVPGVCRYSLHHTFGEREVVNIWDMRIDTTGTITDRAEAIEDQAGILINQWTADIMAELANNLIFTSVSWVDLDSATGSVGSRTSSGTVTLPYTGQVTAGEAAAPNLALLVKKVAEAQRGARSGRTYLCGLTEGMTTDADPTRVTSGQLALFQAAVSDFLTNVDQSTGAAGEYDSSSVVVTTTSRDASGRPLTGIGRDIVSLQPQALLATQRRRLRG